MPLPDLVEVLAHLDFAVGIPVSASLAANETEQHINKVLGEVAGTLGGRYTFKEIRSRLWQKFSQGEIHAEYNFVQLFLHGSSQLALEPETRRLVEDQLKLIRLHEPDEERQFRRGRAKSAVSTEVGKNRSRKRRTRAKKQVTDGSNKQHHNVVANKLTSQNKVVKARYRAVSSSTCQTIRALPKPCVVVEQTSLRAVEKSDTTTSDTINCELTRSGAQKRAEQLSPKIEQVETCRFSHRHEISNERLDLEASHQETMLLLATELAHYKRLYQEAEEERTRMQVETREIRSWRNTHAELADIIQDKGTQIRKLEKKLSTQTALESHIDGDNLRHPVSNGQPLRSKFSELKSQLPKITVINGTDCLDIGRLFGESTDLDVLLSTVFPGGGALSSQTTLGVSSKFNLYELVQALTGAAIHQWVFESEFWWPAMIITPLLQRYREHIATLCGDESLWQLDGFVHRSMVEEAVFKGEIIPIMASSFTTRVLNALQPLFKEELRDKTTEELGSCIRYISIIAIHIRSMSLVATEKFVSIWPPTGSAFDDLTMETVDTDTIRRAQTVRLPLCPGIQAYPKEADLIDYQGFGHASGSESPSKDALKALVVC